MAGWMKVGIELESPEASQRTGLGRVWALDTVASLSLSPNLRSFFDVRKQSSKEVREGGKKSLAAEMWGCEWQVVGGIRWEGSGGQGLNLQSQEKTLIVFSSRIKM